MERGESGEVCGSDLMVDLDTVGGKDSVCSA